MLWRRLAYLLPWRRRAAERDIQEELRSLAAIAGPGELGNLTLAAEDARAALGWTRLEQAGQDLRYAARTLRRSPSFTIAAVLSLALGIGANTALFTLFNAVSWRMLPVREPESLLLLAQQNRTEPGRSGFGFNYQQYRLIRDHNQVLDLAAYSPVRLNVAIDGRAEPPGEGLLVSGRYFPLLGVAPALGRALGPDDDLAPLAHPVAMISHAYWARRFGLDPAVLGRQLSLSGVPFTIVGIAPPGFFGVEVGSSPDLIVPLMMQPAVMPVSENLLADPRNMVPWLHVFGRLKPGVSPQQASASLSTLAESAEWRPVDKRTNRVMDVTLVLASASTGLSDLRSEFSTPLRILLGVVAIVLLIACANVGTLALARSAARRSEFAVRLALGASRGRLARQVLVEGLVIAALAGACGIALAYLATHTLVTYVSAGRTPIVLDLRPDGRVLAFTAAVAALAGVLFSSVPALRASRIDSSRHGAKDLASTRHAAGARRCGHWLVVVQVALSLVLLIAAGLFMRSLLNLRGLELGMDPRQVVTVQVEPRGSDQRNLPGVIDRLDATYRDLLARVEQIPGVVSASLARTGPTSPIGFGGKVTTAAGQQAEASILMVYPNYFATMGLTVLSGRDFDESDLRPGAPLVALANEAFVRRVPGGQGALGPGAVLTADGQQVEIVGIVRDSRFPSLRIAPEPTLYQTFRQTRSGRGQMVLHVRVAGRAGAVIPAIRDAVQRIDGDVPTFDVRTVAEQLDAAFIQDRLIATLASLFGAVALVLVSVGLYGLMSFTVRRRTPEIGVRMALGAAGSDVGWLILRQTLTLVLFGIAVGVPAAWVAARLSRQPLPLFALTATDPATFAAAIGALVLVGMAAGWLPARRAARIDPIVALRND
jgi:predicted permease